VLVPYLLDVAFKVSSVFGIWIALNLKFKNREIKKYSELKTYPVELIVYFLSSKC